MTADTRFPLHYEKKIKALVKDSSNYFQGPTK